jgi:putative nucleotidyltransferase with HDIG domain
MQFIEGRTLDEIMDEGLPELDQSLVWMTQMAEALHFAHSRNVLHHDVKAQNIMVDAFGRAVLLDFGLAKIFDRLRKTEPNVLVVSPEYASPEALLRRDTDARSDIYSLGSVFYKLATGHLPHEAPTLVALLQAKLKSDPAPCSTHNPEIPDDIATLIDQMVRRKRTARPRSMQDVVQILSAYRPRENGKVDPALTRITNKVKKIPPFPHVGLQLMRELKRENTNAERLNKIINADSVLAARILRVVNSAYYGIPNRVATIKHGVTLLGLQQIQDLAFGIYLRDLGYRFSGTSSPLQQRYWTHSVAVAFLAEELSRFLRLGTVMPGEAYMAGLLHDIGLLVLSRFEVQKTSQTIQLQAQCKMSPIQAELHAIGTTHAVLGEWLAEKWDLPETLKQVIQYHHVPRPDSPIAELETVVRIGDVLATRLGYGFYLADWGWQLEAPLHKMLRASSSAVPDVHLLEFLEVEMKGTLKRLVEYLAILSQRPEAAAGASARKSFSYASERPVEKPQKKQGFSLLRLVQRLFDALPFRL